MNQLQTALTEFGHHSELMAGAIHHLRNAMETRSRRSCAVACMLFACLSQDDSLGEALCKECKGMGECLESLTQLSSWGNQP